MDVYKRGQQSECVYEGEEQQYGCVYGREGDGRMDVCKRIWICALERQGSADIQQEW